MYSQWIAVTTDFGDQDGFVGIMKGVMTQIHPDAQFLDISHSIPRQNVAAGAMVLAAAAPYMPSPCVHLVVVDPGVGTSRKAIIAETARTRIILPDNGLITMMHHTDPVLHVHEISNTALMRQPVSNTFHGRDIFAPAAAHAAAGVALETFGPRLETFAQLPMAVPEVSSLSVLGHVIYTDIFGNAITNIRREHLAHLPRPWRLQAGDLELEGPQNAYSEVDLGQPLFLFSSNDYLEIAINGGNAQATQALDVNTPIRIHFRPKQ